jgi:hypothetical protein
VDDVLSSALALRAAAAAAHAKQVKDIRGTAAAAAAAILERLLPVLRGQGRGEAR